MTIEDALPTFECLVELEAFMESARHAGDTFTHEQMGMVARRKIELQKDK